MKINELTVCEQCEWVGLPDEEYECPDCGDKPLTDLRKLMTLKIKELEEGQRCPMFGNCEGTMEYPKVENCSCHINPPCSACTENVLTCNYCGYA